jgi:hypothetical protein
MKPTLLFVALAVSCTKQPSNSTVVGPVAYTPRQAVANFMSAVEARDLTLLGETLGTPDGTAIATMGGDELTRRGHLLFRCLRHSSYTIGEERVVDDGTRLITVRIIGPHTTRSRNFIVVDPPSNQWVVQDPGITGTDQACTS